MNHSQIVRNIASNTSITTNTTTTSTFARQLRNDSDVDSIKSLMAIVFQNPDMVRKKDSNASTTAFPTETVQTRSLTSGNVSLASRQEPNLSQEPHNQTQLQTVTIRRRPWSRNNTLSETGNTTTAISGNTTTAVLEPVPNWNGTFDPTMPTVPADPQTDRQGLDPTLGGWIIFAFMMVCVLLTVLATVWTLLGKRMQHIRRSKIRSDNLRRRDPMLFV